MNLIIINYAEQKEADQKQTNKEDALYNTLHYITPPKMQFKCAHGHIYHILQFKYRNFSLS